MVGIIKRGRDGFDRLIPAVKNKNTKELGTGWPLCWVGALWDCGYLPIVFTMTLGVGMHFLVFFLFFFYVYDYLCLTCIVSHVLRFFFSKPDDCSMLFTF